MLMFSASEIDWIHDVDQKIKMQIDKHCDGRLLPFWLKVQLKPSIGHDEPQIAFN